MKWWGWLTIAVIGPLIWIAVLAALESLSFLVFTEAQILQAIASGAILIWLCCISAALVQKARRK
jgi:hypothetical protein